jgi:hypothetical protein
MKGSRSLGARKLREAIVTAFRACCAGPAARNREPNAHQPQRRDRTALLAELAAIRALTPKGPRPLAEELVRESRDER